MGEFFYVESETDAFAKCEYVKRSRYRLSAERMQSAMQV